MLSNPLLRRRGIATHGLIARSAGEWHTGHVESSNDSAKPRRTAIRAGHFHVDRLWKEVQGEGYLYLRGATSGGWGPGGCTPHQIPLTSGSVRSTSRLPRARRADPSAPPRRWLHSRQITRVLSMWSSPPRLCGMMWSTSGERGVSDRLQSKGCRQSGQRLFPSAVARCSASALMRFHVAVPVREVAMRSPRGVGVSGVSPLGGVPLWSAGLGVGGLPVWGWHQGGRGDQGRGILNSGGRPRRGGGVNRGRQAVGPRSRAGSGCCRSR